VDNQQNTDNVDTLQLKDVAVAIIFWLSIYGVHIGATWRKRLKRPCVAAMWTYVKLLWPLVINGRPFVKCFALPYRTVVCLFVLSVTLVYCGQTVGRLGCHFVRRQASAEATLW